MSKKIYFRTWNKEKIDPKNFEYNKEDKAATLLASIVYKHLSKLEIPQVRLNKPSSNCSKIVMHFWQ